MNSFIIQLSKISNNLFSNSLKEKSLNLFKAFSLNFSFLFSAAVFRGLLHSALSLQKCCARAGQLCLLLHRRGRARHTAAVRRATSALRPRPRNGGERSPHAKSTADHRAGGGPLLPRVFQVRRIYSGKSGQTDGDGVLSR